MHRFPLMYLQLQKENFKGGLHHLNTLSIQPYRMMNDSKSM